MAGTRVSDDDLNARARQWREEGANVRNHGTLKERPVDRFDITQLAISLIRYRLGDSFGKDCLFEVIGEPTSAPDAAALAEQDPYQFQWWTLGLVKARPADEKKGADRGIDGRR